MRRGDDVKAEVLSALQQLAREHQTDGGAEETAGFLRDYYEGSAPSDLVDVDPLDLYGAAVAHRELANRRKPGEAVARVVAPRFDVHGWSSKHAAVQVVIDDMPFVVDSLRMAITRRGLGIHVLHHPIVDGVSMVHVDVDRHAGAIAKELTADLVDALRDVRVVVDDWQPMFDDLAASIAGLGQEAAGHVPDDELAEALEFLRWLADDNFTFIGVRSYELTDEGGKAAVCRVLGTGLGILRGDDEEPGESKLSPTARRLALEPAPLTLTKANAMSTVHRPSRLDYVGVRHFDADGRVIGERRYLGLFAARMYTTSTDEIPIVRRKVELVREMTGFAPASHSDKDLLAILETYPRDELVQVGPRQLYETALAIHQLEERRLTRVFLRQDDYQRFWSVLVYLPRDRYNTTTRLAVERLLVEGLHGESATYEARVSESTLARLHYVIHGGAESEVDHDALEARIAAAVRDWSDDLHELLVEEHGEDEGVVLWQRYGYAFSAGYRAEHRARVAVADIDRLEALGPVDIDFHLYHRLEAPADEVRLRVYRSGPSVLVSDLVPMLEHLGARVIDQRPYTVEPEGPHHGYVYDVGMRVPVPVDVDLHGQRVVDALHAVWHGRTESDGYHQLVFSAELTWREASLLRAYSRYLRQTGVPFSSGYVESCITAHPDVARSLVELFHAEFRPPGSRESADDLASWIESMLDDVVSLDEDRVLRSLLALVRATLRTNVYQRDGAGQLKSYLSFKFDSLAIPDLPLPRPHCEIFVYSPRVEGVHLRGSPVARGGLRWSDRREDYRTEVLGLMKAQMVKNAVIVPAGAKGGFVVKEQPSAPEALREEVVACYRIFVSGLLDLTDNLDGDEVVPPPDVVRIDGDDAYLVVAADKGTATFSDIANDVAERYGFWLGDAFASGGSVGYDHKVMGITARGAWESVKRHFRELHVDVQRESITVMGIGDMAGDVFGNGMLLSPHLKLVGAFNHLHVFLDPDPDTKASFAERQRLFDLPRSTWDDYDQSVLSSGGGVFPRSAKSIKLTPEVKALLGVESDALAPNGLIHAMLQAPVDLLWNGGIGTYVKASSETHTDVGDKANDNLRVDAAELRCRVVGEGGNLGLTQPARIEFARLGGRINTDAIDNSAGVDCSDHEVNIKIVLDAVVGAGDLTAKQRDELLASMTDDVADLVLADNVRQNQALANAVVQAPSLIDVHQRYLRWLELNDQINRIVEHLPGDEELAERKADGHGLMSPEFAVLLAYTKNVLADELLTGELPDDPWCDRLLFDYFPDVLGDRYPDQIRRHRLHREIVATVLANEVVDHQGITSLFRVRDETGASATDTTKAFVAATELFGLPSLRAAVAALDHRVPAPIQTRMLLEARRLGERAARWLLRSRSGGSLGEILDRFGPGVGTLVEVLPSILVGAEKEAFDVTVAELTECGVPGDAARRVGCFDELLGALDCVELAEVSQEPVDVIAAVRFQLEDQLGLRPLMDQIIGLGRDDRWQSLARLSLREDLHSQVSRLTGLVLESTDADLAEHGRVRAWSKENKLGVARIASVLGDIRATGEADLATLSVGLREVTQLG
ncbi:MAG: NAD-glutamate dehydrogenase [Acidimicrobiales bacterium]